MKRLCVYMIILLLFLPCWSASAEESIKVGFIWSEFNSTSYGWARQEQAIELLEEFGIDHEKITDQEASDPENLSKYKVITAVCTYKLPNDVAEALVEYVQGGGKLVWADGPNLVTNPDFPRVFGFKDGYQRYYNMRGVKFSPKEGNELALEEVIIPSGATNAYLSEVTDTARVWATMNGPMALPRQDYVERSINALMVNGYGRGIGILVNWNIFTTVDPSVHSIYPMMIRWVYGQSTAPKEPFNTALIFPNPVCKDEARIVYHLSEPGQVVVQIYDERGRSVRRIPLESVDAGYNDVIWDIADDKGQEVSPGIYTCVVFFRGQPIYSGTIIKT